MQIIITLEAFKAVSKSWSNEQTRYYLNGVYVEPNTQRLVSTDRHTMFVMKPNLFNTNNTDAPITDAKAFIISKECLELVFKAFKPKKKEHGLLVINTDEMQIQYFTVKKINTDSPLTDATFQLQIPLKIVYGTFPDYMRIIPHFNDEAVGAVKSMPVTFQTFECFNPSLLARTEALGQFGTLFLNERGGPAIMRFQHHANNPEGWEAIAVIMPVRHKNVGMAEPHPAWLYPAKQTKTKAA